MLRPYAHTTEPDQFRGYFGPCSQICRESTGEDGIYNTQLGMVRTPLVRKASSERRYSVLGS